MGAPSTAQAAILQASAPISPDAVSVRGPDFDSPLDLQGFLRSYERIGFQATSFGRAIEVMDKMVS
jgi:deoxyhypusine synthase